MGACQQQRLKRRTMDKTPQMHTTLVRCWDYKMYVIKHGGERGRWRRVVVEGFGGRRQGTISRLSVNNKNTQQSTSKWQTINTMKNMCIIVVREGEGEEYINNAYKWNNFVKNDRKLISLCVLDWRRLLEIERSINYIGDEYIMLGEM